MQAACCFTPPPFHLVGLACHDPVQWVVAFLFWSTIGQHQWVKTLSLCLMYVFLHRSAAKSLYLWSSPILSGCSSRHPQSKPQIPIFPPQGRFTGRSLGDHLAILLLWHHLFITSQGGSLAWGGTVHLSHVWQLPIHKEHQPLMQWEEAGFGGGLVTIHVGLSIHRRAHQLWFAMTPPKSLHPTYPWSSSFPSRHLPSLLPGCQVSDSQHLLFCHSTIFVGMPLQSIEPAPPAGCSSISLSQMLHRYPLSWQRPLSWGPHCCQQWGRQSQLGA